LDEDERAKWDDEKKQEEKIRSNSKNSLIL
jgi:hypothetical protein